MVCDRPVETELLQHFVVALEYLYGIPSLLLFGHVVQRGLFYMRYRVLHASAEGVHGNGLAVVRGVYRRFGCLHYARAFERGYFDDFTPQLPG